MSHFPDNALHIAYIRRPITPSRASPGFRFAATGSPRSPRWLAIAQPHVFCALRRIVAVDGVDHLVSDGCRDCTLSEVGDDGCVILALVSDQLKFRYPRVTRMFTYPFCSCYSFVVIKVIMGVNLISYATRRRSGMEAREAEDDAVNRAFGQRDPIGEGKEEQAYNRELRTLLDNRRDDVGPTAEIGELGTAGSGVGGGRGGVSGGGKKKVNLNDLTRFTMVKRIW
jgi:hypothetical protein